MKKIERLKTLNNRIKIINSLISDVVISEFDEKDLQEIFKLQSEYNEEAFCILQSMESKPHKNRHKVGQYSVE